jgi:xanthine dehydrogenase large subunit
VASQTLSLPLSKIKIESTNTTRIANSSPTAASCGADLNGNATQLACLNIYDRLKAFAAQQLDTKQTDDIEIRNETVYLRGKPTELTWDKLILAAYFNRLNLSAQAHYATPNIHFDEKKQKGKPFSGVTSI